MAQLPQTIDLKSTRLLQNKAHGLTMALLFSMLLSCLFAWNVQAQTAQTIKMIVPFTPGTGMDTIARAISPKLSERLGVPVIVQNSPGASGKLLWGCKAARTSAKSLRMPSAAAWTA